MGGRGGVLAASPARGGETGGQPLSIRAGRMATGDGRALTEPRTPQAPAKWIGRPQKKTQKEEANPTGHILLASSPNWHSTHPSPGESRPPPKHAGSPPPVPPWNGNYHTRKQTPSFSSSALRWSSGGDLWLWGALGQPFCPSHPEPTWGQGAQQPEPEGPGLWSLLSVCTDKPAAAPLLSW